MLKISLKGKTLKGKNRIRELGADWFIVRETEKVLFSQFVGPWWLVQPVDGSTVQARWVHAVNDVDFEVVS